MSAADVPTAVTIKEAGATCNTCGHRELATGPDAMERVTTAIQAHVAKNGAFGDQPPARWNELILGTTGWPR